MNTRYMHLSHLDASAAVKLVVDEPGSSNLRLYFSDRGGFFITGLCLAEALGVFKRRRLRQEISAKQYFDYAYLLLAYVEQNRIHVDNIQLADLEIFSKVEEIARHHNVDLSDALQLVSVKYGRGQPFVQESKTVFITADRALADAARGEGLRVWNCEETAQPPDN